jgi:hypothetical protein
MRKTLLAVRVAAILAPMALLSMGTAHGADADSLANAITNGKASINLNLRYEGVEQDNALKDADALTLRTRLNYTTAEFNGFSSVIEFEDSRVVAGMDDYNDSLGHQGGYSVIADPETTELDQGFVQYKNQGFTAKAGRQVLTFDGQRFVGDVGWRQDRQTFDGMMLGYQFSEAFKLDYMYVSQRNRIFAEDKDLDAKDHLINASLKTDLGLLSAYSYLLEVDDNTNNALDTYGVRFDGAKQLKDAKLLYALEYATQDSDAGNSSNSANYYALEVGAAFSGITTKLGYEVLGSDDGLYGFATPLATLHKFNGWADQFLMTPKEGLVDMYALVSVPVAGGAFTLMYHKFEADSETGDASATVDDLGSEIDVVYTMPVAKNYTLGVKYAAYSAGDAAAGRVDTDKVWLWGTAAF